MMLDCDDPTTVHKFCSMLPAFGFEARPVIPIEDAVRVELESIAFRDALKRSEVTQQWPKTLERPNPHSSFGDKHAFFPRFTQP